jgi:transcriptional regulator with XRE-family HTH domain
MERQHGGTEMTGYPLIDVLRTGQRLKEACIKKNIEAKEIKQFLGLAAMQSIYNWFQGKALPSLDNFYALSSYLGIGFSDRAAGTLSGA